MNEFYIRPTYWNWVRSEAALIDTDGCSAVTGLKVECCFEHDLGYYFAKDPRHAYLLMRGGHSEPWDVAKPLTRACVDKRFRQCLQNRSSLGRWSPMAMWRWLGVKYRGQSRWDAHRAREQADGAGV